MSLFEITLLSLALLTIAGFAYVLCLEIASWEQEQQTGAILDIWQSQDPQYTTTAANYLRSIN